MRRLPSEALVKEGRSRKRKMFYVYLIQSEAFPEQRYVGFTSDLKKRIATHNAGGSVHTSKYKPLKLVSYHAFLEEHRAREFEHYLKTGPARHSQTSGSASIHQEGRFRKFQT